MRFPLKAPPVEGAASRPQKLSTKLPGKRPVLPFLCNVPLYQPSSRFLCTNTMSPSFSSISASLCGGYGTTTRYLRRQKCKDQVSQELSLCLTGAARHRASSRLYWARHSAVFTLSWAPTSREGLCKWTGWLSPPPAKIPRRAPQWFPSVTPASCHWLLRSFRYFWCWPVKPDLEAGAAFRLLSHGVLTVCQCWQQPETPHRISLLRVRKGRQASSSLPAPNAWASSSGVASEASASSHPVQDKLQDMGSFYLLKNLAGCCVRNNHLTSPSLPAYESEILRKNTFGSTNKWHYKMVVSDAPTFSTKTQYDRDISGQLDCSLCGDALWNQTMKSIVKYWVCSRWSLLLVAR